MTPRDDNDEFRVDGGEASAGTLEPPVAEGEAVVDSEGPDTDESQAVVINPAEVVSAVDDDVGRGEPPESASSGSDSACVSETAQATATAAPQPDAERAAAVIGHPVWRLPNCKIAGTEYVADLAGLFSEFNPVEIQNVTLETGDTGVDCNFDTKLKAILCRPMDAGDFDFKLNIDVVKYERHVFPLRLTVNPDPKTLWKNIPSDQNAFYAKPDSSNAFLACGDGLSIVAASQRGRSHAQDGKPRDDDFAYFHDEDRQYWILAAADGAGSARFSRKGSEIAVKSMIDEIRLSTSGDFWTSIEPTLLKWKDDGDPSSEQAIRTILYKVLVSAAFEARKRIGQAAKDLQVRHQAEYGRDEKISPRDFATTLMATIVKRIGNRWFVASYWVGDGAVAVYRPDGTSSVLLHGMPDGGEFGGQTAFLTMDSVWPNDAKSIIDRRIRFDLLDSFKAVVLMTDGISDPKFETDNRLRQVDAWDDLWHDIDSAVCFGDRNDSVAERLLSWMDFWSLGNHDDRTLLILY